MIKKAALFLFLFVTAAVIAVLAIAATRPAKYHVERSAVSTAPPEAVFGFLNDLHRFRDWSPWEKLDPNMKVDFSGPEEGVGASYHWVGNKDVGEGRMSITESEPSSHVGMKLEFIKPFASTCDVRLALLPEGGGSRITWSMDGDNNFVSKVMCLFVSMDKMVGKDFETGLANLKSVAEASAETGAPADAGTHGMLPSAKP